MDPLRIALLTYRGNPHSGGQGVYTRQLSGALALAGHTVEVLSGPPYPELPPGVGLVALPSLELYRPTQPFLAARRTRTVADLVEHALISAGQYPEPLAFGIRAARWLRSRADRIDVVHDNQCLAYPLLRTGTPTVATIHHPVTVDRDLEIERRDDPKEKRRVERWYGFTRMQARVAQRLPRLICPAGSVAQDVAEAYAVDPDRISVVPNGVDTEMFRPHPAAREVEGRIMVTTSADIPLKGLAILLEAVAKLRSERHVELVVVGRRWESGPGSRALADFDVADAVTFRSGIPTEEIVRLYGEAQVAVVPSLYEGFSLPAVEAMSCGVPLIVTTGGALPEVAGPDGDAAIHVPPGDAAALGAALRRVLDDGQLRKRMAERARQRVLDHFTWVRTAEGTVGVYRDVLSRRRR